MGEFVFNLLDCKALIRAQGETEVEGPCFQISRSAIHVDLKHPLKAVRRGPVGQSAAVIGWLSSIAKPNPALGFQLLEVRPAVRGENERDGEELLAIRSRITNGLGTALKAKRARIALGLVDV